jgi:spore coat polysaccharide biosynthesis protein SpsF
LRNCQNIKEIVVATTTLKEDDRTVEICKKIGCRYFRGSASDVLGRFYDCATQCNADVIVRLTADNLLLDSDIIDKLIEFSNEDYDYISNVLDHAFPLGFSSCEIFRYSVLEKLHQTKKDSKSREHVTPFIRENPGLFKIKNYNIHEYKDRSEWRLTIDYKEDLILVKKIFNAIADINSCVKFERLIKFLDENKELLDSNKKVN